MGILRRFKDIMDANFNNIIDKYEKPDIMIDQYMRNLERDLGDVKAETAKVMALQKAAEKRAESAKDEVAELRAYAEQAVQKGNENDARLFLKKQLEAETRAEGLAKSAENAAENSDKMRLMHAKLTADIETLRAQRDELKSRYAVARTKQQLSGISEGFAARTDRNISGFNRMKDKITFELDKAEAASELDAMPKDEVDEAKKRYSMPTTDARVEERLAQLKASLRPPQAASA